MTTKSDVIKAAIDFGIAYYAQGLNDGTAQEAEKTEEQEAAYEKFKSVLDKFEKALLKKEEKPCNQ